MPFDFPREKPTFLVIGAPKCGTTSICYYIAQHPNVFFSNPKEPTFFEAEYEKGLRFYWKKYFNGWSGQKAIGEGRAHNMYLPYVPLRIKEAIPDAKLIAILRNPVERAYSHWWHRVTRGHESLTFENAILQDLKRIQSGITFEGDEGIELWKKGLYRDTTSTKYPAYLELGYYSQQLRRYFDLFSTRQIKIVLYDDLSQHPVNVTKQLWEFIGVNPNIDLQDLSPQNIARVEKRSSFELQIAKSFWSTGMRRVFPNILIDRFKKLFPKRKVVRPMLGYDTKEKLKIHFQQYNRELEKLLGRDLSSWDYAT